MRGRICCCSGRGHCESHEQGVSRGEQPWRVGCSRRANLGPLQGAHGRREGEEQLANGCRFAFHHHTLLSTSHVTLAPWVSIECMREGGTTTQYPHSSGADWPGKNERRRSRSALPGRQKLCILFFFSPLLRRWYLSDPAQQPFRPPVRTVDLDSWNFPPAGTSKKSARREGKKKGYIPGLRDRRWPGWTRIEYMCAGFSLFDEQLTNHHAPSSFEARIGRLRGQRRGAWLAAAGQYVRSQRPLGQLPGTADVLVSCNFLRTFCVIHHSLVIGCYRWYSVLGPCGKKKNCTKPRNGGMWASRVRTYCVW